MGFLQTAVLSVNQGYANQGCCRARLYVFNLLLKIAESTRSSKLDLSSSVHQGQPTRSAFLLQLTRLHRAVSSGRPVLRCLLTRVPVAQHGASLAKPTRPPPGALLPALVTQCPRQPVRVVARINRLHKQCSHLSLPHPGA